MYSRWAPGHVGGESEAVIGRWLQRGGASRRDKVVIATKVGFDLGDGKGGLSAKWICQGAEDSLRRLQTDRIDLYQAHKDDEATPLRETLEAFGALMQQGKVRAIGASNYSAQRLQEALDLSRTQAGLPRFESLQPLYNLQDRVVFERELQPLCLREGLGVVSFYALAAGFLSGKYRRIEDTEGRARASTIKRYLNERGLQVLAALDAAAKRTGAPHSRIAVAWVMSRPGITAPIASASNLEQVAELVEAARLVLDQETLAALDAATAQ